MISEFYERLARLVVKYSLGLEKGDRVYITGQSLARDLFQTLYVEILKTGGHPFIYSQVEGIEELKYKFASEEQLVYVDPIFKSFVKDFDGFIIILASYNTHRLSSINPKIISKARGASGQREIWEILMERIGKKDIKYAVIPFPCNSLAQEANMDLFSYFEFVQKALFLDKEDPVKEWLNLEKKQQKFCDYLNKVEKIQIIGDGTDLTMSVKGRIWVNDCGHLNLPDGEIMTAPLEDSVNGHILFTYPGIFEGNEVSNIYLEFKEGKVINAKADKGENFLKEVLKIENADKLGEFAIGNNYSITQFTKSILFDEKMGGTIHCALGAGVEECGSKNKSAIHWDLIKDMTLPESKILANDKIIYEEGKWKI